MPIPNANTDVWWNTEYKSKTVQVNILYVLESRAVTDLT